MRLTRGGHHLRKGCRQKRPNPFPGDQGGGRDPVWGWDLRPGRVAGVPGPASAQGWAVPGPPRPRPGTASPLRSGRALPTPLRAGSEFQGGGAETAGAEDAAGGTDRQARAAPPPLRRPARLQPSRGAMPPRPRDEPGERRNPPAPCPALREAGPVAAAAGSCLRGCVTWGSPAPWAGSEDGPRLATARTGDSHSESRLTGTSLGLGRLPGGGARPGPGRRSRHAGWRADLATHCCATLSELCAQFPHL